MAIALLISGRKLSAGCRLKSGVTTASDQNGRNHFCTAAKGKWHYVTLKERVLCFCERIFFHPVSFSDPSMMCRANRSLLAPRAAAPHNNNAGNAVRARAVRRALWCGVWGLSFHRFSVFVLFSFFFCFWFWLRYPISSFCASRSRRRPELAKLLMYQY